MLSAGAYLCCTENCVPVGKSLNFTRNQPQHCQTATNQHTYNFRDYGNLGMIELQLSRNDEIKRVVGLNSHHPVNL